MNDHKPIRSRWQGMLGSFIIGGGIGWLTGLSISPTIQTVLTAVMAVVGALVAASAGVSETRFPRVDPWPVVALILGLSIAAPIGIFVRMYPWFPKLGIEQPAPRQTASSSDPTQDRRETPPGFFLYSKLPADYCQMVHGSLPSDLARLFQKSGDEHLTRLGSLALPTEALVIVGEMVCPK